MMDFLLYILAFIFALGILITFHEFGHFWVARKCNVKILRFSIGFGRPIWMRRFGEDNTELVVAALPLGGYVKMLDEREGEVKSEELNRAFNRKPLAQRFAIVLAGPLFNFIFAVFAYWIMFMAGLTGLKPVVGEVESGSIAARAGLQSGQEILAVDDHKTKTWTMVVDALIEHVVDGGEVTLTVGEGTGAVSTRQLQLDLGKVSIDDLAEGGILKRLGLSPRKITVPAVIGEIQPELPAEQAGLAGGDRIVSVNGEAVDDWVALVETVQQHPGEQLTLEVERNGEKRSITLIPQKKVTGDGKTIGFIGAANKPPDNVFATESYSLLPAFGKAVIKTWDMSWLTLRMLGKMIIGEASVKNLSGPISIAQYAGDSAKNGLAAFLWFLGIVSVSLGVLNLLPVPLLDGGHLMYYLIEFFKGGPVSESTQIIGQQIGMTLLLGLMILVFYNDIVRLLG